ncbi:hypothetical protein [Shewanella sp. YLB-07]|uniref:hypothetical protein n=1 Tax=Shewanella sp. YLB-07 TaxID=2601268 RepID=UPI00128C6D5E|nr:hypothetical protein [Shewanella sp. YLB-07]MPY24402.1 hypothetical protein [Shewanella sp. YLB-07]
MKTSIIALSITALLTANVAMASESVEEHVNYGDPTASFSTVGLSGTDRAGLINMMYGAGSHIFQLDIGYDKKKDVKDERTNVRARYFHVTDGLGYSVDVLGDANHQTVLGGLIYKFQLTDNISVFPMLSVGATQNKIHEKKGDKYDRSALARAIVKSGV